MQDSTDNVTQRPLNWKDIPDLVELANEYSRYVPSRKLEFPAVWPDGTLDGQAAYDPTFGIIRKTVTKHSQDLLLARIVANLYICGDENALLERERHAEGLKEIIELAADIPPYSQDAKKAAEPLLHRMPGLSLKAIDYILERLWSFGIANLLLHEARSLDEVESAKCFEAATELLFGQESGSLKRAYSNQASLFGMVGELSEQLNAAVPMHPAVFATALGELRSAVNEAYVNYAKMARSLGLMVKGRHTPLADELDRGAKAFFLKNRFGKSFRECAAVIPTNTLDLDQATQRISSDYSKFKNRARRSWNSSVPQWRVLGRSDRLSNLSSFLESHF